MAKSSISLRALIVGLAAAAAAPASVARADTPAINPTTVGTENSIGANGFNYYQGPGNYTFTFDFTANSAIQVTQLGYYDAALAGGSQPQDGFGVHTVSLTDVTTEQTLATTSVTAASPVTGFFNYATIAPVTLNTTDTYQVSGTMTDQEYLVNLNQSAAPTTPQINYQFGPQNIFGSTGSNGTYNDFGPNFEFASGSNCTENRAGVDVIALLGDVCTAGAGTYHPTTTTVTLPVTYNGFGFYAHGGTINSPGAVTIVTTDPRETGGSYGVWADTTGSQINLGGTTSVTTSGANSHGVYASGGGHIVSTGALSVTTTGTGAIGVYASGAGSSIDAAVGTISTTAGSTPGVKADTGGAVTLTGGTVQTAGTISDAFFGTSASITNLSGVQLKTTGNAAKGIDVQGAGTTLTGVNLTISTSGTLDTATGFHAQGVYNGSNPAPGAGTTGGGAVTLTDTSVTTSGVDSYGVDTANNGVTKFYGGSIATSGGRALGVYGSSGSVTTIGLDSMNQATTVSTTGLSAEGVGVASGASAALTGTTVSTTGDGAGGLFVNDAGSSLTATNVTVSTRGGIDTATTFHADGVYNGPNSTGTSGGTLTLNTVAVNTAGFEASGVVTAAGGVTTITGGSFTTSGENAAAVNALNSGRLQISGATLSTSGLGSAGLVLNGTGGSVVASDLTITTTGQISTATGSHADGVYNGSFGSYSGGGAMSITNMSVTTSGDQAYGVSTAAGATTFTGGSVATSGDAAHAVIVRGAGSTVALAGTINLTTSGNGAAGILASLGGVVTGTGAVSILTSGTNSETTGLSSFGVNADGAGASVALGAANIATSGVGAVGILASDRGETGAGGVVTVNGALNVSTQSAYAYDVYASAPGAKIALNGATSLNVGAGAFGLYATGGGAIATAGNLTIADAEAGFGGGVEADSGSTIALGGPSTITLTSTGVVGLFATPGGVISSNAALTINAGANDGVVAQGGQITLAGPTSITTTAASSVALLLDADGSTFSGTGGGAIHSAGVAVEFSNGANQSAQFTNYTIDSLSGDLVFADAATGTVNFSNTTANAGGGNLANVTEGSALTLNASASALTGAVQTVGGSTTTLNLSNGSSWSISGSSTLTHLSLNNSSAGFAAPSGGAFKTLTVNSYTGVGASLTFNAMLGTANPAADQLVINGGQATGSTKVFINAIGGVTAAAARLPGALAPPSTVPLIVTANGGSITPGAFVLAAPVVAGGYVYTLQAENGGEYLVGSQGLTTGQASGSLASLAQSRQSQAITNRVLSSILTGATEQINCSSCSSGFASFGSFAFGAHGRWTLSPSLAVLAGVSFDSYSAKGVSVPASIDGALAVRYDMVELGRYRPFLEAGVAVSPMSEVKFQRSYNSSLGGSAGNGDTTSHALAVYGRAGYIWRVSPIDEAAVYSDVTRSWESTGGYNEGATAGNPFGALVAPSLDTMNIWQTGAQYTHLFGEHLEVNVSAGYAVAFDANYGTSAVISGFGSASGVAPSSFEWAELGGRVSYRFTKNVVGDVFGLGTLGAEPAGSQIHGGVALRMEF